MRKLMTGAMLDHEIHADEFGQEGLPNVRPIRPAHHRLHEERLKDEEPEGESGHVFDDQIDPHRQAKPRGDHRRQDDARRVACHAMNRRPHTLLPQCPRIRSVRPATKLAQSCTGVNRRERRAPVPFLDWVLERDGYRLMEHRMTGTHQRGLKV
jgi:hypothetical protein